MEEEAEEDALGYLTLLLPVALWLFDLLGGVTPLLQVGLSAPGCGGVVGGWRDNKKCISHLLLQHGESNEPLCLVTSLSVCYVVCVPPVCRCVLLTPWRGLRLGEPG